MMGENPAYRFQNSRYAVQNQQLEPLQRMPTVKAPQLAETNVAGRAWQARATHHPDFLGFNPTLDNPAGSYIQYKAPQV